MASISPITYDARNRLTKSEHKLVATNANIALPNSMAVESDARAYGDLH
jgi:hypothetical protein